MQLAGRSVMATRVCRLRSKVAANVHTVALFSNEASYMYLCIEAIGYSGSYTSKQAKGQRSRLLTTDHWFTMVYCLILLEVLLCYTITVLMLAHARSSIPQAFSLVRLDIEATVTRTVPIISDNFQANQLFVGQREREE